MNTTWNHTDTNPARLYERAHFLKGVYNISRAPQVGRLRHFTGTHTVTCDSVSHQSTDIDHRYRRKDECYVSIGVALSSWRHLTLERSILHAAIDCDQDWKAKSDTHNDIPGSSSHRYLIHLASVDGRRQWDTFRIKRASQIPAAGAWYDRKSSW